MFKWDGREWKIEERGSHEFDEKETLAEILEESSTIKIKSDLDPEVKESVLVHEIIERALDHGGLLNIINKLLEQGAKFDLEVADLSDLIADALDAIILDTIKRNPQYFPKLGEAFKERED